MVFAKTCLNLFVDLVLMFCITAWIVIEFVLAAIGVVAHNFAKLVMKLAVFSADAAEKLSEAL